MCLIFINLDFQIQIEGDTNFLTIYDGGSDQAVILSKLNGTMNDSKISTSRNQVFAVLNINGISPASLRLYAVIIKSKYIPSKHDLMKCYLIGV